MRDIAMGLIERLRRIRRKATTGSKPHAGRGRPRGPRRRDPDYATLPGGDSIKEAGQTSGDRARELAD